MKVLSDSTRVRRARKVVYELLASSVGLSTAPGLAATMAEYGERPERFGPCETVAQPVKIDNDLYVRDYGKCVLCYKCVEACGTDAQNTFAIAVAGRGFGAGISTEHDVPLPDSACVYCGNCIAVSATGALMAKPEHELRAAGRWNEAAQTVTDTICGYCGVGCTLRLHVQDGRIVKETWGTTHVVKPEFDRGIERRLEDYFARFQTMRLSSFDGPSRPLPRRARSCWQPASPPASISRRAGSPRPSSGSPANWAATRSSLAPAASPPWAAFLGSVASKVLHLSKIPVTFVK